MNIIITYPIGPKPKPKPKPKIFVTEVKKGQKTYIFVVERKKCANCGYKYLIKNNDHTCRKGVTFVNIAVNRRLWFCRKSCKQEFVTM